MNVPPGRLCQNRPQQYPVAPRPRRPLAFFLVPALVLFQLSAHLLAPAPCFAAKEEDKDSKGSKDSKPAKPLIENDDWIFYDAGHHTRPQVLNLQVGTLFDRLGAALWYAIPLADDGILPRTNDAMYLEFGGIFITAYDGPYWRERVARYGVFAAVGPKWNLYLTHNWTLFSTIKLGALFGFDGYSPGPFGFGVSVGGEYRLRNPTSLRLELGYPMGLSVGISFDLGGT